MRLPPNYGSVTKLSGKRRNPYMVRITVGYNELGVQKYKVLGYTKTRKEGLELLASYHAGGPTAVSSGITFTELYDKFVEKKEGKVSESSIKAYRATFNASKRLHKMAMVDIKTSHMQDIVDEGNRSKSSKMMLKNTWSQMFELAIQNDILNKNYASFLETGKREASKKEIYSAEDIQKLWENEGVLEVDVTLVLLYTGMRIGELVELKMENVHLDERYMLGGLKTDAGRDRMIPISKRIIHIVKRLYGDGTGRSLIVKPNGQAHTYRTFSYIWEKRMKELGIDHSLHETRHTTVSNLYAVGIQQEVIRRIVGHSGKGVTEDVYLHLQLPQLLEAVDKLE